MQELKKSTLNRTLINPLAGLGVSISTTCITLWHGYALYFVIAIVIAPFLWLPFVLKSFKTYFLMNLTTFFLASCFNCFGLLLLFFPSVNGGAKIYFVSDSADGYLILSISFAIFLFFILKKFYEVDYTEMYDYTVKNKMYDKEQNIAYLNPVNFAIAPMRTTGHFLKQTESLLFKVGVIFLGIVAIPALSLSSMMARTGNGFFVAFFFFIGTYAFFWFGFYCAMSHYVQYRFIQRLEKDSRAELKFMLKNN